MSGLDLTVRVSGVVVGRLQRNRDGLVRFHLDSDWLDEGQMPRLGLAFLRAPGPRLTGTGLPLWFEGLLPPPDSALRARACSQWGLRESDSASLLSALGRDLPGAVEIGGQAEPDDEAPPSSPAKLTLGFSLAGMQLKFSMAANGERLAVPARDQDGSWIVKVPGRAYADLPRVELTTMRWGEAMGLPVPECRAVGCDQVDGLPEDVFSDIDEVFAIRRFDRKPGYRRIHQEDFAQALEIHPTHLYGNTGPHRTSADLVGRLVMDVCGAEAANEYVDRLAFVIASGNGDAHLKNHSWQWLEGQLRPSLAPLYDQVSTVAWHERFGWGRPKGPGLALAVGKTRAFGGLTTARIERFAERSRIPNAKARLLDALARAREAWPAVAERAPERLVQAMAEHWQRTPVLRSIGGIGGLTS